jgi:hypothetical protein
MLRPRIVASIGEFGDSNPGLHNFQPRDGPLCTGSPLRLGVSIMAAITIGRE